MERGTRSAGSAVFSHVRWADEEEEDDAGEAGFSGPLAAPVVVMMSLRGEVEVAAAAAAAAVAVALALVSCLGGEAVCAERKVMRTGDMGDVVCESVASGTGSIATAFICGDVVPEEVEEELVARVGISGSGESASSAEEEAEELFVRLVAARGAACVAEERGLILRRNVPMRLAATEEDAAGATGARGGMWL